MSLSAMMIVILYYWKIKADYYVKRLRHNGNCDVLTVDSVVSKTLAYSKPKKSIILYARHRTGSTFTLKMFQRHKDIFTFFEPLNYYYLWQRLDLGAETLKRTLDCDLAGLERSGRRVRDNWVLNTVICFNQPYKFG